MQANNYDSTVRIYWNFGIPRVKVSWDIELYQGNNLEKVVPHDNASWFSTTTWERRNFMGYIINQLFRYPSFKYHKIEYGFWFRIHNWLFKIWSLQLVPKIIRWKRYSNKIRRLSKEKINWKKWTISHLKAKNGN